MSQRMCYTVEVSRVSRRCLTPTLDTFSAGRRLLRLYLRGCQGCQGGFQKLSRDVRTYAHPPAQIMVFDFRLDTLDTLWLLTPQALRVAEWCLTPTLDTPLTPLTPTGGEA
jgi:hypothetical protein